jgi:hypothetical protein
MTRVDFYSEHTFVDNGLSGRTVYTPFIAKDGRVGYSVQRDYGPITYVYLNPSSTESDPTPNVFVYEGVHNDPGQDEPVCFVTADGLEA